MLWSDDFRYEVLCAVDRRRRGDSGDLVEDVFGSAGCWVDEEVFGEGSCYPSGGYKRVRNYLEHVLLMMRIARVPIMPQRMVVCFDIVL